MEKRVSLRQGIKSLFFLVVPLIIILLSSQGIHASNYNWNQSYWSGGASTGAVAIHPANLFSCRDNNLVFLLPLQKLVCNLLLQRPRDSFCVKHSAKYGSFKPGVRSRYFKGLSFCEGFQ